jgi:hypothetical protein
VLLVVASTAIPGFILLDIHKDFYSVLNANGFKNKALSSTSVGSVFCVGPEKGLIPV